MIVPLLSSGEELSFEANLITGLQIKCYWIVRIIGYGNDIGIRSYANSLHDGKNFKEVLKMKKCSKLTNHDAHLMSFILTLKSL